jgi:hypothetical protein
LQRSALGVCNTPCRPLGGRWTLLVANDLGSRFG